MSKAGILGCLMLAAIGCGGLPEEVSDTGYQGTWQRGNDRVKSTISIVEVDGEYLFRWAKTSVDGKSVVKCDWEGTCAEYFDGEKTADLEFRPWVDEESGRLRVECRGRTHGPEPSEFFYIEELVLRKKGLAIRSWTLEDSNGTYTGGRGPRRNLAKISDYVLDPPPGWTPPTG
jgi:hypothetical protein